MAFCDAPSNGTLAPPPVHAGDSASTSDTEKRGGDPVRVSSSMDAAAKHCLSSSQQKRARVAALSATMAFCEAPFEGTLAPPMRAGDRASSDAEKRGGDSVTRVSSLMEAVKDAAKHCLPTKQPQQKRRTVDGLAIYETVCLQ